MSLPNEAAGPRGSGELGVTGRRMRLPTRPDLQPEEHAMSSRAHRNSRSFVRGAGTAIVLLLGVLATPARAQVTMVYYDFQDNAPLPTVGETSVDMSVAAGGAAVTRAGKTCRSGS